MAFADRIDRAIAAAIAKGQQAPSPGKLASALEYSVFPGGARIRPTILLSVATACGDDSPQVSDAAATALELIHCASLVHGTELSSVQDVPQTEASASSVNYRHSTTMSSMPTP